MQASKSTQPSLIFLRQVFLAHVVSAGFLGCNCQVAFGEHGDALAAADAVGQHDCAADDLVGLLGIDAQADVNLDRLIELRIAERLENLNRFTQRLSLFGRNFRRKCAIALGLFGHIRCLRHESRRTRQGCLFYEPRRTCGCFANWRIN